jgi:hypothetical protein
MRPEFRGVDDGHGFVVVDPIQGRRYPIYADENVDPTPASTDGFHFPVSRAVAVEASRLRLPTIVTTYVRGLDGGLLAEIEHGDTASLPDGEYLVEFNAPIKLYLRVDSAVELVARDERLHVSFGATRSVRVGARSYHRQPSATVTTTDTPEDAMEALSYLSSSLKTLSPERSFPTLRGHPPRIELGDELHVPDYLENPETGIRIRVPLDRGYLYPVAPLAFYLGADLVAGESPQLVTEAGVEHPLDTDRGFETEVARVLKHVFVLDCVVRTEGYYPVDLHERAEFESRVESNSTVEFDASALYDQPIAERVGSYLRIPHHLVSDLVPTWRVQATCTLAPESVELLPYVVNDLGLVRTATARQRRTDASFERVTNSFARGASSNESTATRGTSRQSSAEFVRPFESDAVEDVWVGDGRPVGDGKLLQPGFEHKFERDPSTGPTGITVVCNDPAMRAEIESGDLYGGRVTLPFGVQVHEEVTTAELRDLLATRTDFLHYVGHVEDGAFVCEDGRLHASTVECSGAFAFLLNGCASYSAGRHLVEAGSVGGIVTHSDVGNASAVEVGQLVARLLNRGFSLGAALDVARRPDYVGNEYVAVGDTGGDVLQSASGTLKLCELTEHDDGTFTLCLRLYPTREFGLGSMSIPAFPDQTTHYLTSGPIPPVRLSREETLEFLDLEMIPVFYEGDVLWSNQVEL